MKLQENKTCYARCATPAKDKDKQIHFTTCAGEIKIEIGADPDTSQVADAGNGLYVIMLGDTIGSPAATTKFRIDGSLAMLIRVDKLVELSTLAIDQVGFCYGNPALANCVYVHSANFGKKLTYEYGTLQSSVSSYEMNTIAMKLNKLNPAEIEKTKTDVADLGARVTSLENTSGGTDTVIAEIKNDIAGIKNDTEGISRAESITNIDALKTNSLKIDGVVDGVLKDAQGFTYLKVIKGKPKTLPMGYSNVDVLIYPDNSCLITGVLTETNNEVVEAGKISGSAKVGLPCEISSIEYISLNDISDMGARFLQTSIISPSSPFLDIKYRNITDENQNIMTAKLYFRIKGTKNNYSDINIV